VSVDNQNGGIGFGSLYNPPGGDADHPFPGDAAYPIGIQFDVTTTQYDLQSEKGIFGAGSLSCAGFPNGCILPPILGTSKGDLVLAGPSTPDDPSGAQMSTFGTFSAEFPVTPPPAPVPEPSTWAMMLLGFVGLGFAGWRGQRKTEALGA
jgi:PEP-CTERM motif